MTVLVKYRKNIPSGNPHFDDTVCTVGKIVAVDNLLDLNTLYANIVDVKILIQ